MPFYKGLARWNSLTLAFILCFEGAIVPVPLEAKNRKGEKIMKDAQDAEARGQYEKALELEPGRRELSSLVPGQDYIGMLREAAG